MAKKAKSLMKEKDLEAKQALFCQEYIIDLNAKQAAIRAGYSAKTAEVQGSRLLSHAKVQVRIQELMTERSKKLNITADYVLEVIHETIQRCRQSEPVLDRTGARVMIESESGDIVPAYQFNANGALKGAELLGRHLKMFTDKHEHSGPDGKPLAVSFVDDIE